MNVEIEITLQSKAWLTAPPEAETIVRRAITAVLWRHEKDSGSTMEVSVLLADDDTVRELNRSYRGKDSATNVLAFPGEAEMPATAGQPRLLGDILLAHGTLLAEAAAQKKSVADHLAHLTVHACLHLLGYDHLNENEAQIMEAEEIAILAEFGIADPYSVAAMDDARALP